MYKFRRWIFTAMSIGCALALTGCSLDYKSMSTPSGKRAILDRAANDLTYGHCQSAIDILQPLYSSIYVDNEVRLAYASAQACSGGMDFPKIISGLSVSGGNIWSAIVEANWASSTTAGPHLTSLQTAASVLWGTASNGPSYFAANRPTEANVYMLFLQMEILGTILSPLGEADPSNGKPTLNPMDDETDTDRMCAAQVAFSTIIDCINHAPQGSIMSKLSDGVSNICDNALWGVVGISCPTNLDPSVCRAGAGQEQDQGHAILKLIQGLGFDFPDPVPAPPHAPVCDQADPPNTCCDGVTCTYTPGLPLWQ